MTAPLSGFAQTVATYTGTDGSYANPANWDIGVVPLNSGGNRYSAAIGADQDWINFDPAAGAHELSGLSIGTDTTFTLNSGRNLSVLGSFTSAGGLLVSGPGTAFDFTGPGPIQLDGASIMVESGAHATIASAGPAHELVVDQADPTQNRGLHLLATDTGSLLDLDGFHSIETRNGAGLRIDAERAATTTLGQLTVLSASDLWVSSLNASEAGTIHLPSLSAIQGTHFFTASTGGTLATASTADPRTLTIAGTSSTTFRAEDAGSRIDFSSIDTFALEAAELSLFAERDGTVAFPDLAASVNSTGRRIAHHAYDGGTIELPVLTAIDGEHSFTAGTGGIITAGVVDPVTPRILTLTGPGSGSFRAMDHDSVVDLSAIDVLLAANNGCLFHSTATGSVLLDGLQTSAMVEEGVVSLVADGGTITLSSLANAIGAHYVSTFNGGRISLTPGSGATRSLTLTNANTADGFRDSFTADGAGSVTDLSCIESIEHIGLSAWYRGNEGGLVDLSRLKRSVGPDSGTPVSLRADDAGGLLLGELQTIGLHRLRATGAGSIIAARSLDLGPGTALELVAGAVLHLSGSFRFAATEEHAFSPLEGTIAFTGSGTFEVGGLDAGAADPGNDGNFGFGRLIVGAVGAPANVALVDLVDNGNRTGPEALYLHGTGGLTGLSLLDGSELCLNRLPVYVAQPDGTWLHLNSLFAGGVVRIPYDGGYLRLTPAVGYADWSTLLGLPTGQDAPGDDPNRDGTNNLLCYAFGLNPLATAPVTDGTGAGLPRIRVVGPQLEVTFSDDSNRPDATLVVESSTDLVNWDACGDTVIAAAGTMQIRQSTIALSGQPRLFARVRATLIAP
ncbi:MAG: hypothetical protein IPL39_23150 [Opitutaceae bacterium]|nr:hypothetical protein [Opitutaceae bacterium]